MIFDLDGTLVQTERLKALSYARAAVTLRPRDLDEAAVMAAFKDVVGLSRREVAQALLTRFDLTEPAEAQMAALGVSTPWQAYVQLRLRIYEEMLADPGVIRRNQWPHNVTLLQAARRTCRFVGLATMSYCTQVQRVLDILALSEAFDFVASRDDVEHGKPDPEIYLLVAHELGVTPAECLVVEDSPAGVKAALAAGMGVIAVSTPFTRERLHASGLLPEERIVDEPEQVAAVAASIVRQSQE
jgi:beta-phosphoglucomutase